jgi:ABC-type polysaccharide/polyol phosphate transport system ATPase subunit
MDRIRLEGVGKRYFRLGGSKLLAGWLFRRSSRSHDWFWSVRDVNLHIPRPGASLGIIGANGSGKTTLLRIIAGVTRPTSGTVTIHGQVVSMLELFAGMQPELTGRENIFLNGILLGMRRREIQRKLDSIVEFAGIGEFLDMPFKHYSLGMQMRLGFSLSTHVEASIFLVDEAWGIGDAEFQSKISRRLKELAANGATLLLVSHDLEILRQLADETLWLHKGETRAFGPTEEVLSSYLQQRPSR